VVGTDDIAQRSRTGLGLVVSCLLVASCFAGTAAAQPSELNAVIDGMVDAKIIKQVDYSFYAVAYDEGDNVLYFAARDGGHFDPAMEVVYSVPIAAIDKVSVVSNTDVTVKDGELAEMGTGGDNAATGDFIRLSRGCTVKLVAKEPNFGWAALSEGQVSDGDFTVDYADLELDATKTVDVGFFECDHARAMQEKFHKLHQQVKKGT